MRRARARRPKSRGHTRRCGRGEQRPASPRRNPPALTWQGTRRLLLCLHLTSSIIQGCQNRALPLRAPQTIAYAIGSRRRLPREEAVALALALRAAARVVTARVCRRPRGRSSSMGTASVPAQLRARGARGRPRTPIASTAASQGYSSSRARIVMLGITGTAHPLLGATSRARGRWAGRGARALRRYGGQLGINMAPPRGSRRR